MPNVIPVKFAFASRELWFDPKASQAQEGDFVICSTERGTEIGLATQNPREVSRSELSHMIGSAALKPVLRVATESDLDRADELARKSDDALFKFRTIVHDSDLDMKPVGVEYLFGGEKVVCYFSAEERVDFRQLVRDLAHEFRERIDMRQIGVREEAAFVGGFGHCGQELCCARIGLSFEPVSIRMAKEQDLPLTSNKISGACGRLMCCLRYEFEAYRDFKGRAPKRNAVIDTPLGKAKVIEYDTPKEQIALRIENGKVVRIPIAEMIASEAAQKKSEELKCPCRPDTVVRSSLEKLNSPDVQMALAELDRKMGVVPEDSFDEVDLFVEIKPKRRRSRGKDRTKAQEGSKPKGQASAQQQEQEQAGEQGQKRTRRRRRRSGASTPQEAVETRQAKPASVTASESEPQQQTRRRRRHKSAQTEDGKPQATQQAASKQQGQQTANRSEGGQRAEGAPRPRRRPGDKGGQKVQQQSSQAPQSAQQSQTTADGAPAKRRRRRRRRSGGAKGAEGAPEATTPKE